MLYLWILSRDLHFEWLVSLVYFVSTDKQDQQVNRLNRLIKYLQVPANFLMCLINYTDTCSTTFVYSAFPKNNTSDYFNGLLQQETAIHNQLTGIQSLLLLQDKATHRLYSIVIENLLRLIYWLVNNIRAGRSNILLVRPVFFW